MKRTIIFLVITCIVAAAVGVFSIRVSLQNEDASSVSSLIHSKLHDQLDRFSALAKSLVEDINEGKRFPLNLEFPFFLIKEGSVISWSDHHIAPPTPGALAIESFRFVRTPGGGYLFKKWIIDEERELMGAIPLFRHYKIQNQYLNPRFNEAIFGSQAIQILEPTNSEGILISAEDSDLFRVVPISSSSPMQKGLPRTAGVVALLLSMTALVILAIFLMDRLARKYPTLSFAGLGIGLYLLRITMMSVRFPSEFSEAPIFDPKNFASSELNPSLGDLFINTVCVFLLCIFLLRHFARFGVVKNAMKRNDLGLLVFVVSAVAVFFGVLYPYVVIQTIYNNSQISLSITRSLEFDLLRIVAFAAVIISCLSTFIFVHIFIRILTQSANWMRFIASLIVGILIFSTINEFSGQFYYSTLVITLVFFLIVLSLKLNKTLVRFKYNTFVYLVTAILALAFNCTFAIEKHELKEQVQHQSRFASNVLIDRDYFGEFLLRETLDKIKNDAFISVRMSNPVLGKDAIKQKIRQYHLPGYFNKYNTEVQLFTSSGSSLENSSSEHFAALVNRYGNETNKTEYTGVYFVGNLLDNIARQYVAYTPINRGNVLVGYVILELSLKRIIPESVYPELLVDTRFQQVTPPNRYSYAVFLNRQVQLSSGDYNYDLFEKEEFSNSELYSSGIINGGYVHTATEDSGGKIAVVSTPTQPFFFLVSDFSFLFILGLMIVFLFLLFLGLYNIYNRQSLYLSARIQLIINLAFFAPLIGVSVVTLGLTASASQEQINNEYLAKSKSFAVQISNSLNRLTSTSLEPSFNELTRLAGLDANIFTQNGKLLITSQPEIFENQLLGGLINPEALRKVRRGDKNFVSEEYVGNLNYFVAYSAVYSPGSGNLTGIVALPFFQSASSLERMQISVLSNILIIFMILFVILLVISALVSRWLTYPLNMITQKLGKISLVNTNQPLVWDSNDEIGIMVREYNQMLEKLSENKLELERTQREQAWREIAQQVAHEIKNPLTPMKLTLQQLERLLGTDKNEKVERSLSSLLTQVDTLDGIASSFSTFAKMPEPVLSRVELVRLTENIVELHKDSGAEFETVEQEALVIADKQLIGRIFSNIILNGLQSAPGRVPEMLVRLVKTDTHCRVVFIDKGAGIAPELREKIFLPHFTTKQTGSGLGLAIAKQGIEQMGGRIWFDTEVNVGTTFYVELPITGETMS